MESHGEVVRGLVSYHGVPWRVGESGHSHGVYHEELVRVDILVEYHEKSVMVEVLEEFVGVSAHS